MMRHKQIFLMSSEGMKQHCLGRRGDSSRHFSLDVLASFCPLFQGDELYNTINHGLNEFDFGLADSVPVTDIDLTVTSSFGVLSACTTALHAHGQAELVQSILPNGLK